MFRIRRIYDDITPANKNALAQASTLLRRQFELLDPEKIKRIPEVLRHPLKYGFKTILYVAEDQHNQIRGLALLDFDAGLSFCFLDYLASDSALSGRGIGAALYERLRGESLSQGAKGIFMECLPDDPALCHDPEILAENKARLRFYEQYGARPIINTAYETPVQPDSDNPPYLVFDGLGREQPLAAAYLRQVVERILKRKYPDICSPEYVRMVVDSIQEDPVRLRPPRYKTRAATAQRHAENAAQFAKIALVITDQHEIHHIHERGYVEAPVRIRTIEQALEATGLFKRLEVADFPEHHLSEVHEAGYLRYFKRATALMRQDKPIYPYVFPIRNRTKPPLELPVRAGYYCIDTFTPLNRQAYIAARRGVDCALTAAREIVSGRRIAYALVRPPGHHAEHGYFGGFCYFNNAAIAAQYLSRFGAVAMLDIDYHHGNGQQDIFYRRRDVLTISLHGHPRFAYPYFSGFSDEQGEDDGKGFNLNLPLPELCTPAQYLAALEKALQRIRRYRPTTLVLCLGLDTAKGDPTGTWMHKAADFTRIGRAIGSLRLPTVVVQEGGYRTRSIGVNARAFFQGLLAGMEQSSVVKRGKP